MKKIATVLFAGLLLISGCQQHTGPSAHIKVHVEGGNNKEIHGSIRYQGQGQAAGMATNQDIKFPNGGSQEFTTETAGDYLVTIIDWTGSMDITVTVGDHVYHKGDMPFDTQNSQYESTLTVKPEDLKS